MPAGTPQDVILKLNAAFNKVLSDPETKQRLVEAGYEVVGGEPQRFSAFIETELKRWGPVVKKAKLQPE